MDLYEVSIEGSADGCHYSNTYKVVANTITEAIGKAVYRMEEEHNLKNVHVRNIKFIESGIIV